MKLSELQSTMRPAAESAIENGLTYEQAGRAFQLILIGVALEQSGEVQKEAAAKLNISPAYLCNVLKGRLPKGGRSGPRKRQPRTTFQDRHGAAPAVVIGEMEI